MIDRLIDGSLRNRLLVLVLTGALAAAGFWAYREVPIDSFPDVTPTMVQVFTVSPGLSPVDMETQITYPVEISMYGLPALERVQSTSIFGLSRVNVYFEDGTDVWWARRLVMERLDRARERIPPGLGEPQLGPASTGLGRIFMYEIENTGGADHSLSERRTAQDWITKPRLRTVPGVTGVLSVGGHVRQYQVDVDMDALLARGLTLADVEAALGADNRNVGGSFLERGGEEHIVRGYGWFAADSAGLDDIRDVVLSSEGGTPVYVDDVATVEFGSAIRRGTLVADGEESVGGFLLKLVGTNTRDVLSRVEAEVQEIDRALPDGMELVEYYSQGDLVEKAVGTVRNALLQGAVLVLLCLYLFLGSVRSTLVVVSVLPFSALAAFIGMRAVGMSANLMSLGGLAIGIGIMVDGAVVVVENVYRLLEERGDEDVSMVRLVGEAAREVGRPVVFAIGIIVVVFLPLFTLQGVEGRMFSPMAWTISFALLGAMVLSLTFIPVLSSYLFGKEGAHEQPRLVRWLRARYRPIVSAAVDRPKRVLGAALAGLAVSLAVFPFLGTEFVPTLREGTFFVRSVLPPGANLPKSVEFAKRAQATFDDFPEVTGTYARVGRAEVGGDPEPVNVVASLITLKPLDDWESGRDYEELQSLMADSLSSRVPGLSSNFSQPIQLRTDELLSGVQAQVVVSLYGDDLDTLASRVAEIERVVETVDGAVDVRAQQQAGKPQVLVRPDRRELSRLGISVNGFLESVETGIGGSVAGQVFEGIRRFSVFVRLQEDERSRVQQIRELPIRTAGGAVVPLSRVADVDVFTGPKRISRNRASRRSYVQLNVRGRDMGSVVEEIRTKVSDRVDLPPGYFVEYGGQFENQQRAMERLYVVVPVTLALIFFMLFLTYGSLRYAALIFLNVPFAVIGGVLALLVSGQYMSVPAAVGFIAVFGVAVENGVVLVSCVNQLRGRGMETGRAVLEGAERRLRPVLMTASVTILGLVPLLLANDVGSNVQRPLAAVVVGGLFTSTALTLLVLPSVYPWFAEPVEGAEG